MKTASTIFSTLFVILFIAYVARGCYNKTATYKKIENWVFGIPQPKNFKVSKDGKYLIGEDGSVYPIASIIEKQNNKTDTGSHKAKNFKTITLEDGTVISVGVKQPEKGKDSAHKHEETQQKSKEKVEQLLKVPEKAPGSIYRSLELHS